MSPLSHRAPRKDSQSPNSCTDCQYIDQSKFVVQLLVSRVQVEDYLLQTPSSASLHHIRSSYAKGEEVSELGDVATGVTRFRVRRGRTETVGGMRGRKPPDYSHLQRETRGLSRNGSGCIHATFSLSSLARRRNHSCRPAAGTNSPWPMVDEGE